MFYPRLVGRLGSHILFRNAIVDAALLGAKIGDINPETVAFWADHRPHSNAEALRELRKWTYRPAEARIPVGTRANGYSIYSGRKESIFRATWAPRPLDSIEFLAQLSHLPKVRDLFQVRQGARTGLQSAFIITKQYLQQLPAAEREYFRPAVLNESINSGVLIDSKYIFYPHGEREIESERALGRAIPTYYADVLRPHKSRLQQRAKTDPEKWWRLTWSRTWQHHATPKLVSVFFGDKGSFAWDKTGTFVVVQGYAWLPKAKLRPFRASFALAYLAILNSDVMSELLAATSNSVRGGQWDLATRFVENIPMLDLSGETAPTLVDALATYGRKVQSGEDVPSDELTTLVRSIYMPSVVNRAEQEA